MTKSLSFLWLGLALILFFTGPVSGETACDRDALAAQVAECGFDMDCMNRVTTEFNSRCTGSAATSDDSSSSGSMPQMSGGSMDGMMGDMGRMLQQLQNCGGNQQCLEEVGNSMPDYSGDSGGSGDFDTTYRIGESTVIPASWLQSYQEAFVHCGSNASCKNILFTDIGQRKINAVCGPIGMNPASAICRIVALNELHIEQAIAQQRLAAQLAGSSNSPPEIEMDSLEGLSSEQVEETLAERTATQMNFLNEISESDIRRIIEYWQGELEEDLAEEGFNQINNSAAEYPLEADPALPPLVYEESESEESENVEIEPTRRDWAYSLMGMILTDVGLARGETEGEEMLDYALWCFIQAVQLKPEAEHYSNIGFHLNLRGELDDGEEILTYARSLAPDNPEINNNLAFTMLGGGMEREAEKLQQHAARMAPEDYHIQNRLREMLGMETNAASGGDFGEAFYRLSKKQAVREYLVNGEWTEARDIAMAQAFSGSKDVVGAYSYYKESLKNINEEYRACAAGAPEELRACPQVLIMMDHPSCKDAPDPEQAERRKHNRNVHLCQCQTKYIQAKSDVLTGYLNSAIQTWVQYERTWWPKLNWYRTTWSKEIQEVNSRSAIPFPLQSAYWGWADQFMEDSDDVWNNDIPGLYQKWYELKEQAVRVKTCKTRLPPIPKKERVKPKKKEEEKKTTFGLNFGICKVEFSTDGDFKASVDLGVVKGGYEYDAGRGTHKISGGSGPIEVSYHHGGRQGNGFSVEVSTNALSIFPGGGLAGQVLSLGSKHQIQWTRNRGWSHSSKGVSQSKFGFSYRRSSSTIGLKN